MFVPGQPKGLKEPNQRLVKAGIVEPVRRRQVRVIHTHRYVFDPSQLVISDAELLQLSTQPAAKVSHSNVKKPGPSPSPLSLLVSGPWQALLRRSRSVDHSTRSIELHLTRIQRSTPLEVLAIALQRSKGGIVVLDHLSGMRRKLSSDEKYIPLMSCTKTHRDTGSNAHNDSANFFPQEERMSRSPSISVGALIQPIILCGHVAPSSGRSRSNGRASRPKSRHSLHRRSTSNNTALSLRDGASALPWNNIARAKACLALGLRYVPKLVRHCELTRSVQIPSTSRATRAVA